MLWWFPYILLDLLLPLGLNWMHNSIGQKIICSCLLIFGVILLLNANMCCQLLPFHILCIPWCIFLGGIYSCFGVTSSVLEVVYTLTLVERTFFLFLFRYHFPAIMASGKYLRTSSDVNPIHVGKFPFYMALVHVVFSEQYIHRCQYWISFSW